MPTTKRKAYTVLCRRCGRRVEWNEERLRVACDCPVETLERPSRTILLGAAAIENTCNPACVRVVVSGDSESWTVYAIIDRRRALRYFHWLVEEGYDRDDAMHSATKPQWSAHYRAPGYAFAHEPWRRHRSRRYIVVAQSGGLDI